MPTPSRWISLPENRSAESAILRVRRAVLKSKSPKRHNPLLLHGPTGSGKSKLVSLLVEALSAPSDERPLRTVVVPAKDLAHDEGQALVEELVDLLVIEDVHQLPERATESMTSLVDRYQSKDRQLVITSLEGPALLSGLSNRLTSRLGGGLVVSLHTLGTDSRRTFLLERAAERGLTLEANVLDWLTKNISGSCRALEGALAKLVTLSKLVSALDIVTLRETFTAEARESTSSLESIVSAVARRFGVTPKQMRSPSRQRSVLRARQAAMYLARTSTTASLRQIAEALGRSDHTTVLHACSKIESMRKTDLALRASLDQLTEELTPQRRSA